MIENRSWTKGSSRLAVCALVAVSLAACGGGQTQPDASGSQDSVGTTPTPTPTPSPSPTPTPTPTPSNTAPVLAGDPPLIAKAGTAYLFVPAASDVDNDALTFTATGLPAWATFNQANGSISGTPQDVHVGTTGEIEIVVSDGTATDSIGPFRIQVGAKDAPTAPANNAPSLSGNPSKVVMAGTPYIFVPTASDTDGDTLIFAIAGRPTWATFNTSNGQLSGTPARTLSGTTASNIRISVSDGKTTVALAAFSIQITQPANTAPVVSGTPSTSATVGTAYSFTPGVSDAENDRITWSIQNRPAWATFNTTTGRLSGTPTATGTASSIRISASDGFASTPLPTFSITVAGAANRAPSITGNPPTTAVIGTPYSFSPTGSDPDTGTSLTYSIANQPDWASFSTTTGTLSGTPGTGKAGTYSGIVIRVTDGIATASLASFTITVTAPAAPPVTGSATLGWTPPSSNTDGTPIQGLAGYRIYYGNSASTLNQVVTISNPGITSYVLDNLLAGSWFFSVRAFTNDGTESSNSSVVSKTIQ
jgi:hypothetical protein